MYRPFYNNKAIIKCDFVLCVYVCMGVFACMCVHAWYKLLYLSM